MASESADPTNCGLSKAIRSSVTVRHALTCATLLCGNLAHAEVRGLQDPANPIKPAPPPAPEPPDPVVDTSATHGLESMQRHRGLNFTLAIGGVLSVPIGIDNGVGRGGSGSVRLGHMAGERWAFTAELANITLLHRVGGTDQSGNIRTDLGNNVLVGLQFYVNRVLWIRGGVGIGSFKIDQPDSMKQTILPGPSGVAGGGLDLVRFRRTAIGVEVMSLGMLNRDGLLTAGAFMVDLSIE